MRHIIAHLIRGGAGKVHRNITKDLTLKFGNVAILKKPNDKWVIDRVWEIKP